MDYGISVVYEFYANKLCVTAKHLSKVIKVTSGKPANDWIDEHAALEAKALLRMSPSEYKAKG